MAMMHAFLTRLFGCLCHIAVRLSCRLNRITVSDGQIFEDNVDQGPGIFAFWHSRLWFCTYYYVRRKRRRKIAILSWEKVGS